MDKKCIECGRHLTREDRQVYEDMCEECVYTNTAGLIFDSPEDELDFDDE